MHKMYDENYFERGRETGKSNYTNYRWMPEATISMAMVMVDYLNINKDESVLDFGCAKGFLVKALRLLHRKTWGVDISVYALSRVDPHLKRFCTQYDEFFMRILDFPKEFDFCIAKDVFEHIHPVELQMVLESIIARKMFAIVPLGEYGKYNAEINNLDKTHIICESEIWWSNIFIVSGWRVLDFTYEVKGIKDHYKDIDKAHGFFTLEKI